MKKIRNSPAKLDNRPLINRKLIPNPVLVQPNELRGKGFNKITKGREMRCLPMPRKDLMEVLGLGNDIRITLGVDYSPILVSYRSPQIPVGEFDSSHFLSVRW